MNTFVYETIVSIVEEKSFQRASEHLNVTASAVSHAINQIEKKYGFPIFIRNRSDVVLTSNGQKLYPILRKIIAEEKELEKAVQSIQGLESGIIKIGAFSSVCINWLPDILRNYSGHFPNIDISLTQGNFSEISQLVEYEELDIGFTLLPVTNNVKVTELLKDEIKCVTPSNFKPLNGQTITQADLQGLHFILQKADYGILPDLALQKLSGDVSVFPFDEPFYRTISLVQSKNSLIPPAVDALVQAIKTYLNVA